MRGLWLLSLVAFAGCLPSFDEGGQSNGPGDGQDDEPALPPGVVLDAAPSSLRRLNADEYRNTMRDLLGLSPADVASITVPTDEGGIPSALTVSVLEDTALQLVTRGVHRKLVPCPVTGPADDACATKFITTFAGKAFRHPARPDEMEWLSGIYTGARAKFDFSSSIDVVTQVILQSPQLVYIHEEGETRDNLPAGLLRVGPYELASRLSYLLWDSMPDDVLLDAAGQKSFGGEALRAQVKRVIEDPRARAKAIQFLTDWVELDGAETHASIEEAVKDLARYPSDSPALRQAMRRETQEFIGRIWDRGGSIAELFNSNEAYVNAPLAKLYGVTNGPVGDAWAWSTLPPDQRAGIATRAGFLLVYAATDVPSPIRRGAAVLRQFMCTTFPPPPPAANDVKVSGGVDASGTPLSIRDMVTARTGSASDCVGCHSRINPAGFPFGHYDALGQWQDIEQVQDPSGTVHKLAIDATGELVGSDAAGAVDGAVRLSAKLAESRQVKDCLASTAWRSAYGREVKEQETTSLRYMGERLATSGLLRDALLAMIESPAFLYMRKGAQ